jgi:hypothetical protein
VAAPATLHCGGAFFPCFYYYYFFTGGSTAKLLALPLPATLPLALALPLPPHQLRRPCSLLAVFFAAAAASGVAASIASFASISPSGVVIAAAAVFGCRGFERRLRRLERLHRGLQRRW